MPTSCSWTRMRRAMRQADLHHTSDFTPYEGLEIAGGIRQVLVRGRRIGGRVVDSSSGVDPSCRIPDTDATDPGRGTSGRHAAPSSPAFLAVALMLTGCGSVGTPRSPSDPFVRRVRGAHHGERGRQRDPDRRRPSDHRHDRRRGNRRNGGVQQVRRPDDRHGRPTRDRDLGMTAMGCEEPVMAAEAAYTAAIAGVDNGGEGGELVLSGPNVELRFSALTPPPTASVVDTVWVLETLFVGDVASSPVGQPATLELRADGTFSGSTGCRSFSGQWLERGSRSSRPRSAWMGWMSGGSQPAGQPRRERHRRRICPQRGRRPPDADRSGRSGARLPGGGMTAGCTLST